MAEFFKDEIKRSILFITVSVVAVLLSLFHSEAIPFDLSWVAIILCGLPIVIGAIKGLVTEFDITADVLVAMALVASVIIGEYFAAGEIAVIMQVGALLEELTVARARAGIERLVDLTPTTARVLGREDAQPTQPRTHEEILPAEMVKEGFILRVLPGETIPVDGLILKGETSVDQAVMTGESMPVDKAPGDEVFSGTVNRFGSFDMQATKVGEDSSIQRMIRLVQSADAGKAKIVRLADRWAVWIVILAVIFAGAAWAVTGEIIRAVTVLVVFCPCALVLATPTAIMAAIGNATKFGFLVREGDALERLSKVNKIAFDKTGTLTYGTPVVEVVKSCIPSGHTAHNSSVANPARDAELYRILASAESPSEHPLGKAIVASYRASRKGHRINTTDNAGVIEGLKPITEPRPITEPEAFLMIPGQGVQAKVEGKIVLAGNRELMELNNLTIPKDCEKAIKPYREEGCSLVFVAIDGQIAGFAALADSIREDAADVIWAMKTLNTEPVLLTGDHEDVACHVAGLTGITTVVSDCLPETKLSAIENYQKTGDSVCMVGDGINDAPALKTAGVGIAMGGIGSDIAVDAADIVLINDDIAGIPHLVALSKRMMTTIKLNMTFALTLNFAAIALAMTGILTPVVGALVHNLGSVIVILISAALLNWKYKA